MGLGLLGRGLGDARFLAQAGAELTVTDRKSADELTSSIAELKDFPQVRLHLGEHRYADFRACDLVLKGAGVPLDSPFIAEARSNSVPVDMSASFFGRVSGVPMIGITGTRGKSTVTHLIDAILRAAGAKTILGGNVRGVSNLALLPEAHESDVAVFELDSWQCQGFGEECSLDVSGVRQGPHSPAIAVFTTFLDDHMNYYGGSMERYFEDKAQIFLHQQEGDVFVVGSQVYDLLAPYRSTIRGRVVVADETTVPETWRVRLAGAHNRYNIGVAIAVAREYGVEDAVIREAVASFAGVPGRLQAVGVVRGVQVYNDNNATTPDATVAALHALSKSGATKHVVLIAGGADKGIAQNVLLDTIEETCRELVLLPGTGTDRLVRAVRERGLSFTEVDTLEAALAQAFAHAREGDALLFSPAFASFGLFTNEYDRGDQFNALLSTYR